MIGEEEEGEVRMDAKTGHLKEKKKGTRNKPCAQGERIRRGGNLARGGKKGLSRREIGGIGGIGEFEGISIRMKMCFSGQSVVS